MKREQERGGKVEEEGSGRRKTGTETDPAMTIGMAEEATIASAGDNRACSDGGCGENECSSGKGIRTRGRIEYGGTSKTRPLCYGHRSWEKLLRLRGIRTHGLSLQKSGHERKGGRK